MLAPIAQMIFVIYFFFVFSGNIYTFDSIFGTELSGKKESLFDLAKAKIQAPTEVSDENETCLGSMNTVAQKYIHKYFLLVITILFFFYKSMESFITLKVSNFKWYFGVLNFILFFSLSYLYKVFYADSSSSASIDLVASVGLNTEKKSLSMKYILLGLGFVSLVFVIPMSVILAKYK
jgi:hypothetical protein